MSASPISLRLTGAKILRDGRIEAGEVSIAQGCLAGSAGEAEIDLRGFLVLPGIVDLHGDAFERHIRPRPRTPFPLDQGLLATDREAAANGVSTAWLAQSWSWEGEHRSPEEARRLLEAIAAYQARMQTDLRVQLRVETHTPHTCDELIAAVRRFGVDYVIFNDHLGEALQQYETDPAGHAAYCNGFGCAPEIYAGRLVAARRAAAAVPRYLCTLAASFDALGVIYGSHDDPDAETRETYAMIGARICEFPLSRNVARLARAKGDPVLMGAPNVVRGGSQNGNVSATALIAAGECDALVSDYHYPALAAAAFHLSDEGVLPLARAWALISSRPAQIMRLADRGLITEGRRADLAIINEETRAIEATFVAGRLTHLTGEAASRILSTRAGLAMAAE